MLVRTFVTSAFLSVLFSWILSGPVGIESDFDTVKQRVVTELKEAEIDDQRIGSLVETLLDDGTWPGIDYEDVSRTAFEHRFHSHNMVALARAYEKQGSEFYKDQQVKAAVETALANWVEHDYFCENWWHNQIGTPTNLVNLMLIMGEELPPDLVKKAQPMIGRAHLDASGARPSGDRIKIGGILAKNLLFLNDVERFERVLDVIEGEIRFVASQGLQYGYGFRQNRGGLGTPEANGRGMQYDYSFHHRTDGVNNTLSYGLGYADAFAEWAAYVAGTRYSFSERKMALLVDYFLDGICKTAVYGKYPDPGAKNRSISRQGALRAYGARTADRLLAATNYRRVEVQEIADIRSKEKKPTVSHATFFWHSEHFTFQRPEFFTSVRMYSKRVHNMEQPYNSEGLFNHHRGDGSNHISRTGDEYFDLAPVFDYQKIPGTTILQKKELPSERAIQKLGLTDFVGAVTDGLYGAVAFDFESPHDPLCARKSWFFFDEEYVCLGTGISSQVDSPVVTTINQCLLRSDVTVSIRNSRSAVRKGDTVFRDVDWVFHDGIGYLFPSPAVVHLKNNEAKGSWYAINRQTDSPRDEIGMEVFKLWLDHGLSPSDASYEYIVVPATSVDNLVRRSITIVSNTPEIQAVGHAGMGIYQAVFFSAGAVRLTESIRLECDSPGIVMLKTKGSEITEISVSDPNRELGRIYLAVSVKIEQTGEHFEAVWKENQGMSEVAIDLPRGVYAGSSVTVNFR